MMMIRVLCRCGVVLVDPKRTEAFRVALGTVLTLECPHCGEKTTVEIRKGREDEAAPSAAAREEPGKEMGSRPEIRP